MATTYVVLKQFDLGNSDGTDIGDLNHGYEIEHEGIEATNAEQARRKVADLMADDELAGGVTLIAVPERNWRTGRGTLKAETTRRIRSA